MVSAGIARPIGLIALASLIPFIIFYLRRQKPKEQVIPSLMFIVKKHQKSKRFSFFRNLLTNLLFFIQLLTLIGLALTIAAPFVKVAYDTTLENTVIILDVSASMQTKYSGGKTRFDRGMSIAKSSLSGRNSIVLAENSPLIVLEDEDTAIALDVLGKVKPKATSTNLGDALLLGKDILGDSPGRIVVISDFVSTEGPDVKVVRTAIASEELVVNFIDVSEDASNVGIIRLNTNKLNSKIYIKNFNNEEKTVNIKLHKDGKNIGSSDPIKIGPNSIENFVFDTIEGVTQVELTPKDDLDVDNFAYVATPPKLKFNVLLITNEKDPNLKFALEAAKTINLNVVNPPVLTINTNGQKVNPFKHDVIILYNFNGERQKEGILPGTFSDLRNYVDNGGNLIIAAQEDIASMDMQGLNIVTFKNIATRPSKVCVDTINQVTKQFQNGGCFTTVSKFFETEAKKDTITFASIEGSPVLAFSEFKKGNILYYGIFDYASDFKTLPSYPVLWDKVINFLVNAEDIRDYNAQTGKIALINEQEVKTPSSSFTTSKLLMDEVGIYEYDNKNFAVNLLNEDESDVSTTDLEKLESREEAITKDEREKELNVEMLILLLSFILIITEIIIVKFRGGI
tara:strand:+ start:1502 stop:3376 length:1875 start_codon:yes stop_codon:yes gene_type:complete